MKENDGARVVARCVMESVTSLCDLVCAKDLGETIAPLIGLSGTHPDLWEAALAIGRFYNERRLSPEDTAILISAIDMIREEKGQEARTSRTPAAVIFGTSGWRDRIGEGFTVLNVHRAVRGVVEMMRTDTFLAVDGYASFDEVRDAGVIVFRDNRFMGDQFISAATKELVAAGIKVLIAGECPTGVGSALVTEMRAAGSINFTPSHNPMDYAGIKFNPADGGPAAPEITAIIEAKANALMTDDFIPADPGKEQIEALVGRIDAKAIFRNFMEHSEIFDIEKIRRWLSSKKAELSIIVDNMHGSSRGYIQAVLGENLVKELSAAGALSFMHTNDDFSFHGVKPEPSAANQRPLIEALVASGRRLTLAVALDPDADRIRFADAHMDIPMNLFGAIAFSNLIKRGVQGGVASTAPSSDFALEIAKQNGIPFFETPVGFKWFRPYLRSGEAMVAFEESDGISFRGHTLEKCALAGFFAAIDVMMQGDCDLSEVYLRLQRKYGYFYPDKSGVEVKGVKPEEWKSYKAEVVKVLEGGMVNLGDTMEVGGEQKYVKEVNTIDGLKIVFDDRSWILLRASGTEPKFRIYYEVVSHEPIADIRAKMDAYAEAGSSLLQQARKKVDLD
jgi:phosphomannomutase